MAACLVPLFAIPLARSIFAVQLPPVGVLLQVAGVVLAAIAALTLWRRLGAGRLLTPEAASPAGAERVRGETPPSVRMN